MSNRRQKPRDGMLKIEALDPRIMLSATPWESSELAAHSETIQVEQMGERLTFRGLSVPTDATVDTVDTGSRGFLSAFYADLDLPVDVGGNLDTVEVKHGLASSHARYQQTLNGIPVHDAFVSVHMDQQGVVQTVHNAYVDVSTPATLTPQIQLSDAITSAEQYAELDRAWFDPQHELVIVNDKGTGQLAWQVTVFGLDTHGHAGDFDTLIDAQTGQVISQENIAAFDTGTGNAFVPNPYQTKGNGSGLSDSGDSNSAALSAQMVSVTLQGLDSGTGFLEGEYVDVTLTGGLTNNFADEPSRVYNYTRDNNHFEEVVVYHSVDSIQRYFHLLGFDDDAGAPNGIRDFPTRASAHWYTADNSFYSTGDDAIHFGDGGVDDGEDADIVAHEYGHAVQHDQNAFWGGGEMGAMGEAFGDYLAASFYAEVGDPAFQANHAAAVGEWDATSYSGANPPNLRRVDTNNVWPDDLNGGVHNDGQIWSSALWNIRGQLGGTVTDTLVLEHHFGLPGGATMRDAAEAMIQVDMNLNGGANETVLRTEFEDRGILGELAADDHGNNAASATPTGANSTNTGTIEFPGNDTDWFAFTVPAGANVTLETLPGGGSLGDTTLRLYNTNGVSQIAFNDDINFPSNLYSRINYTAATTGTYYVAVGSYDTNTGSYTLRITSDAEITSGDFDSDGDYDCDDINELTQEIVAGTNNTVYDLTGDDIVNVDDLDAWRLEAGTAMFGGAILEGDANLDGTVDGADYQDWANHRFTSNANWCDGDFNADGFIGGTDLLMWNANKFSSADGNVSSSTPQQPTGMALRTARISDTAVDDESNDERTADAYSKTGYVIHVAATTYSVDDGDDEVESKKFRPSALDQLFAEWV